VCKQGAYEVEILNGLTDGGEMFRQNFVLKLYSFSNTYESLGK